MFTSHYTRGLGQKSDLFRVVCAHAFPMPWGNSSIDRLQYFMGPLHPTSGGSFLFGLSFPLVFNPWIETLVSEMGSPDFINKLKKKTLLVKFFFTDLPDVYYTEIKIFFYLFLTSIST